PGNALTPHGLVKCFLVIHIARLFSLRHRQDTGRLWSASDVPVARQTIASREMLKTKAHPSALAHVARKYC
ncbi:hypothetical protein ACNFV7_004778, partial [Shigella sonnei]